MSDHKLSLSAVLAAVDRHDGGWLSRQPPEDARTFNPYVIMRHASAVQGDGAEAVYMLWAVNERVNQHHGLFASLHPDLLFRSLASCGLGARHGAIRHPWIAQAATKADGDALAKLLAERFPEANDLELDVLLAQLDRASLMQSMDEWGIQPDGAKGLLKAYDQRYGQQSPDKAGDAPPRQRKKRKG